MVWLAVVVAIVLAVAWTARHLRGATVYLSHPYGFTAFRLSGSGGRGGNELRPVPRDRYERIVERFMQGDLFDTLWVSLTNDSHGGAVLSHKDGEIEMDASFLSLREPERVAAFREAMASWGHLPVDEHEWNVGLGEDSQSVTLSYRFARDGDGLLTIVDQALEALQGKTGEAIFVHA